MLITKIGYHYTHDQSFQLCRPNGSEDYLLLLVLSTAIFELNDKKISVNPGSLILYNKGSKQSYYATDQLFQNDFIHFDIESKTEQSYLASILTYDTIYEMPNIELLSKLIKELSMEYVSNNSKKNDSMQLLFKLLLIKIEEQLSLTHTDTSYCMYYRDLVSIRSMLYNEVGKKHTVEDLAKLLDLSSSYFQSLYKKAFGISCMQDVIQSKLEYAKYNLVYTTYQVKEIAALCGYENDVHFMRQFKKYTGYTPKEYRNRNNTLS